MADEKKAPAKPRHRHADKSDQAKQARQPKADADPREQDFHDISPDQKQWLKEQREALDAVAEDWKPGDDAKEKKEAGDQS